MPLVLRDPDGEPPTLISLGFEWEISGDGNRNAEVTLSYRHVKDATAAVEGHKLLSRPNVQALVQAGKAKPRTATTASTKTTMMWISGSDGALSI